MSQSSECSPGFLGRWRLDLGVAVGLIVLVFAAYGNSLKNEFVWDDQDLIVESRQAESDTEWHEVLGTDFWDVYDHAGDTRRFYRPVITLSYVLDSRAWGLRPFGFHLTNLCAHALVALLMYALGIALLQNRLLSFLASALFAVHPSHVENVSWIAGRTDVFCMLFFLSALLAYLRWSREPGARRWAFALSLVSFLLSLFGKETGIVLPGLVLVHYVLISRKWLSFRSFAAMFCSLVLLAVAYLALRAAILGSVAGQISFRHWFIRLSTIPMVFAKYIGVLAMIVPTDPHHADSAVTNVLTLRYALYLSVSLSYLIFMFWSWRSKRVNISFALMWFPMLLLPVLNFGGFGDVLWADRFLYGPSIGFAFAFVIALSEVARLAAGKWRKHVACIICFALAAVFSVHSLVNTRYWANDTVLFLRAARASPNSAFIYFNLGNSYLKSERYGDACRAYARAIELEPERSSAFVNMGYALKKLKRYAGAVTMLGRALELTELPVLSVEAVVEKYRSRGMVLVAPEWLPSEQHHQRTRDRQRHAIFLHLGDIYRDTGDLERAMKYYASSVKHGAGFAPHHNLGSAHLQRGDLDSAEFHLRKALEYKSSPRTLTNLGILANMKSDHSQAIEFLTSALGAAPKELSAPARLSIHYNLAKAYRMTGQPALLSRHAGAAAQIINSGYRNDAMRAELIGWLNSPLPQPSIDRQPDE